MTTVTVKRTDILDLISCAQDYGFEDDVLFATFAEWLGPVSDQEISVHAEKVCAGADYGEEDVEQITERITEWRDNYGSAA